ncbi:iron-siderophore ABC transporter substrate-binding protein [Streptomyces sp. JV176]|uniref:iron-siderophore ABC transporter substrate-binding protein n=1 Tax=Streptomyces sp. JV176 TaxID=858630 RepID=UPI002E792EB3|nr:iron-siderophore ABC transporter substrate-binding protein [Streptomyces sp. JV176]MEE1800830.1 iron-siderophore ABC transporter substrate-binding protein [Streptomyces sp. JV176]
MYRFRDLPLTRLISGVALSGALLLTGCSTASTVSSDSSPTGEPSAAATHTAPRTVPKGMGSGKPDGEFPRTVGHFEGKTTIEAAPKKIVVISTGQADALLTLGTVPAGSTRGDGADLVPQYLKDDFPKDAAALGKVVDVGSRVDPNLETIANIKPDLILMNVAGKNAKGLYKALSAVGPTVATQGTGLYWKQDFLLVADGLGKADRARTYLDRFHTDAAALGASLDKPVTVSFLRLNGDRLRVFGVPSFTGSIAEDAGLGRPESQRFDKTSQNISNEQLDRADADWLFYGVQGDAAKSAELTGAPLWPTLSAVAGKTAIPVDDDVFYLNTGPTAARDVLTALKKHLT